MMSVNVRNILLSGVILFEVCFKKISYFLFRETMLNQEER